LYEEHPSFEKPDDENIAIWRYMDFTKLLSLLDKQALFFARGDTFLDPYEGLYPEGNHGMFFFLFRHLDPGEIEKIWRTTLDARSLVNINSWHMNSHESAAMWKLYLKSEEGIAIQSTLKQLRDCCTSELPIKVFIGTVQYIDYTSDAMPMDKIIRLNIFDPFLYKRMSFEHERELRAAAITTEPPDQVTQFRDYQASGGLYVPVDLKILVEIIYVSPTASKWFFQLVSSVVRKYGLEKQIIQSQLYDRQVT
jgi:hypothetical protein